MQCSTELRKDLFEVHHLLEMRGCSLRENIGQTFESLRYHILAQQIFQKSYFDRKRTVVLLR